MSIETLVDQYADCWAEMESSDRLKRLDAVLATAIFYHDPTTQITGTPNFEQHIATVIKQRPGSRVRRTTRIDLHHDVARFGWQLTLADGTTLPAGIDIVWLNSDHSQLTRILGFFGSLKPL